jgi:nucleoside-diphosphate kinase
MDIQRTLSIIKPDATAKNITGAINADIEAHGLRIIAQKRIILAKNQAERFYGVHSDKPFFQSLVNYMSSGPVVVQVLEGENAVGNYRDIMGATDPAKAELNTIRQKFGSSIENNAVHGSDSTENANREISFFFASTEITG